MAPVRRFIGVTLLAACGGATDPPAPAPTETLFAFALIADPHVTGDAERSARLAQTVDWLNDNDDAYGIAVVMVLGDVGWGDGIVPAKELLGELDVPYVPLIGDNEVQLGAERAYDEAFAPVYDALGTRLERWRRAPTPIHHAETDTDVWLQNAAFTYRGVHFFALDWNIRGVSGVLGEFGDLNDYDGGTLPWFEAELAELEAGRIVMLSHIPMFLGAFEQHELATLEALLAPHADQLHANYAGHLHGNLTMAGPGYDVIAVDAVWDDEITVDVVTVVRTGERVTFLDQLVVVPFDSD